MKNLLAVAAMAGMLFLAMLVMSHSAFAQQCVDNGDGTVTDNGTGLMWQKEPAYMDFIAAIDYALSRSLGGHSDWRPPSKDELLELSRSPCKQMMDLIPYFHWSYTRSTKDDGHAWYVNLANGEAALENMSSHLFARAVRDYH